MPLSRAHSLDGGSACQWNPAFVTESESEVAQLCPTLWDPMDCSLLGSSVHGIFQAKVLECGATETPPCLLAASEESQSFFQVEPLWPSLLSNIPNPVHP